MSQSLRERIEGIQRYGVVFHPDHGDQLGMQDHGPVVYLSAVLRIVADHEREQAAVAMGVQPVAQPLSAAEEFPAWLRELELMVARMYADKARHGREPSETTVRFVTDLSPLAELRRIIISGKGEAVIPEGVASDGLPAGTYFWVLPFGLWILPARGITAESSSILSAIDSHANTLTTDGKRGM